MRRWVEVLIPRLGQTSPMAGTERTGRVVAIVGSTLVVLMVLALVLPHLLGWDPASRLPLPEDGGSVVVEEPPYEPGQFLPPPPGCPAPEPQPEGTSVSVGWEPMVTAFGHQYVGTLTGGLTQGEEVLTITCDIVGISGGGQAVVPQPWPDGSSTILGAGTPVHAIEGVPTSCYLMADDGTDQWVFAAVDADGGTPAACEGVPYPVP